MTPEEQAAALAEKDRLLDIARSYLDCQLGPDEPRCGDCVVDLKAERDQLRERIAQLERSNEFIVRCFDEREKALADAYTAKMELKAERDQLKQEVVRLADATLDMEGRWREEKQRASDFVDLKAEVRRLKIRCSEMPVDEVEEHFLDLEAERDHWREAAVSVGQSDGHGWAEETKALRRRVAELEVEARVQAQEARAQRATVREIYQLCSPKGEPGDWNAALPVKKALAAAKIKGMRMARDIVENNDSLPFAWAIDIEIAKLEKDGE